MTIYYVCNQVRSGSEEAEGEFFEFHFNGERGELNLQVAVDREIETRSRNSEGKFENVQLNVQG